MAKAQEITPAHPNYLALQHFVEIRDAYPFSEDWKDDVIKVGTSVAFLYYTKEFTSSTTANVLTVAYGLVQNIAHREHGSTYDILKRDGGLVPNVHHTHMTKI